MSTLEAALAYAARRLRVVPVPRGKKAPTLRGWPQLRLSEAELPQHFSNGENVGIILGAPSGGLVDIDLDVPEAIAGADFFLPPTGAIFGRPSKPRSHRVYISEPSNTLARPRPEKFCAPDGMTICEIRGDGQQSIFPPSTHPGGERVEWASDGAPAEVSDEMLRRSVARLAATALLARHWPQGRRHDCALALAGMLLRGGWGEEETSRFVEAVATAANDEETRQRIGDVLSTARRLATGRTATGAPTLAAILSDPVVARARMAGPWAAIHVRGSPNI